MNISSVSMNAFNFAGNAQKLAGAKEAKNYAYRAFDELVPENLCKAVAKKEDKNVDKFIKSDVNIESVADSTKENVPFINESSIM